MTRLRPYQVLVHAPMMMPLDDGADQQALPGTDALTDRQG
jgi:hypothetical protein